MTTKLDGVIGADRVRMEDVSDLWPLHLIRQRMQAEQQQVQVVRPQSYDEAAAVLRWATSTRTHVIPMGAATGVCGALSPAHGEVVLDLGSLNQVIEIDELNLTSRAQAGIVGAELERALGARGLTLGHFPSSLPISTLGGLISTRSSGQQSTYDGNVEDMLLGAVVALADGTVLPLRPPVRSAVGPALHQLFVGAEGGLGVILEAQLRVRRLPEATVGAGFLFKSVPDGLAAMREVMQHGLRPLVMRLYDPEDTAFQGVDQGGCLLVTAVAGERAIAAAEMQFLERIMVSAEQLGEAPWRHWLEHRFDLSDKQLRAFLQPPGSYVDTIEIAAPWSTLGIVYDEVKRRLSSDGFALCHFSHAYPHGCCAYFTFGGTASSDDEAVARYESRWRDAMEVAARHGATCSHHHGVGQLRSGWAVREMGEWRSVWHALRDALDPAHVLNPNAVGGR